MRYLKWKKYTKAKLLIETIDELVTLELERIITALKKARTESEQQMYAKDYDTIKTAKAITLEEEEQYFTLCIDGVPFSSYPKSDYVIAI